MQLENLHSIENEIGPAGGTDETATNRVSGCLGKGTDVSAEPLAFIFNVDEVAHNAKWQKRLESCGDLKSYERTNKNAKTVRKVRSRKLNIQHHWNKIRWVADKEQNEIRGKENINET